jgi:hypothetical protein
MALQPLALDDLTWADLVAATRRRVPAASNGKWTLHAPVDPGVTLVELYAWQLEQRLYWLDQVPDSLIRALLKLLGDAARPAIPAATVLQLDPQTWLTFAADSVLRLTAPGTTLRFTSEGGITLLPVDHLGLIALGADRTNDLAAGRAVRLFAADGRPGELQLLLWMPSGPLAGISEPLALLLELLSPVSDGWSPDAVAGVPPPAKLDFFYRNGAGDIVPWPAGLDDATGGLRRSGVLRLPIPLDWTFEPGSTQLSGLSAWAVYVRTASASYSAPPRLQRVEANVVTARHRRPADLQAVVDWLPLPGNAVALPLEDTPPIAEAATLSIREAGGWQAWTPTDDFAFHGPADRVFVVDRDGGQLRFGDGLTGRIPRPVASAGFNLTASLDVGGGNGGNLGAGLGWVDESTSAVLVNLVPAEGGADPEPLAEARRRAGEELHRVTRAVTAADYETLALTTPGVALARAHAAVGYHPLHPCTAVPGMVTVFVLPWVPREEPSDFAEDAFVTAPQPDPGALAAANARLDVARLVTHEVCVRGPLYRAASLRVDIEADPLDAASLRERLAKALRTFLDPLQGGTGGAGWPFGEPLRPSALVRQAALALGPDAEVTAVAIGLDGAAPSESCHDVPIGEHALVGVVTIDVGITRPPATRRPLR